MRPNGSSAPHPVARATADLPATTRKGARADRHFEFGIRKIVERKNNCNNDPVRFETGMRNP